MTVDSAHASGPATSGAAAFYGVYEAPSGSPGPYAVVGWHVEIGRAPRADAPMFAADLEAAIRLAPGYEQHPPTEADKRDVPNLVLVLRRPRANEGSTT